MDVDGKRKPGRKKDGGDKLEQFSIRLQPKLKFGLNVLAQMQGRSLSQAIEWALQASLAHVDVTDELTLWSVIETAWERPEGWQRTFDLYQYDRALVSFEERHACAVVEESDDYAELNDLETSNPEKYWPLYFKWAEIVEFYWQRLLRDASEFLISKKVKESRHSLMRAIGAWQVFGREPNALAILIAHSYEQFLLDRQWLEDCKKAALEGASEAPKRKVLRFSREPEEQPPPPYVQAPNAHTSESSQNPNDPAVP